MKNKKKSVIWVVGGGTILLVILLFIFLYYSHKMKLDNVDAANTVETNEETLDKETNDQTKHDNVDKKNAYKKLEVEAFDLSEGIITEECSEGGESIGGIQDGYYTAYYNVDFGDAGAVAAAFRAATPMPGGVINIMLDGLEGTQIGTCEIKTTGKDWNAWMNVGCEIEKVTGVHDVYLIYQGTDYLFNLNWFQFYKKKEAITKIKINTAPPTVGNIMTVEIEPWDAVVSYEWMVNNEVKGTQETYEVTVNDVGKTIQAKVTGIGGSEGVLISDATGPVADIEYDLNFEEIAYESFSSYIDKYYDTYDGFGRLKDGGFWDVAEIYEIMIDAYEHTGDNRYKQMMYDMYNGFVQDHSADWTYNEYNDDIMWMVIACTRAYLASGDEMFLTSAKEHFDAVWERGWSEDLGGGIWWRTDNQTKNACINCPATIAACLLGEALEDETYYDKAKQIMTWVTDNLYEPDTGHVYDSYNLQGEKNSWASTYNQGTFIGANNLLYQHFGEEIYLSQAANAANYTMNTMYTGQVMNNEDSSQDLIGFKGILTRWLYRFAIDQNKPEYIEWLKINAATAWSNRNSEGLMWTLWGNKTDDTTDYHKFGTSTAVSLLNNCRTNTELVQKAGDKLEAESFDQCRGIITEECNEGGKSIDGVQNGFYTVYHNIDFGEGGFTKAVMRAATPMSGGSVEIRVGSTKGKLIGTCEITSTDDWKQWQDFTCDIESVEGLQTIYLIYKGDDYLFNLNWFQFQK
ncbi:MAG: glycoside hydrolase family 76 [Herbinix sp.]|jgi:hypothetical protein|nr:glycoside hydrolase family 76 [Herbinix sp.]